MNFKKVIFYNAYHNGDIHLSRTFVDKIMRANPTYEYKYAHKNKMNLLADVANLESIPYFAEIKESALSYINDDTLYFNTWYGAGNRRFINEFGITFDCLYKVFDISLKDNFDMSLYDLDKDPSNFYPKIDFNKFYIADVDKYLNKYNHMKKVFISNGETLSGQAENFNYSIIINKLSEENKDVLFIASNRHDDLKLSDNLALSENIINKHSFDLNENAYLSTKCNLIFGRSSGTYTFAMIKDNMFDSNKTMISFSNIGTDDNKYWLSNNMKDVVNYKAKVLNYNCGSNEVYKIMNENIQKIKGEK
jgi:hypothetical protein